MTSKTTDTKVVSKAAYLVSNLQEAGSVVVQHSESLRKGNYTLRERVALYGAINPINKEVGKIRKALRDALVEEVESACRVEDGGRLVLEDDKGKLLSQNEKGSLFLRQKDVALELRPSTKEEFNEEAAREALSEAGVLRQVEDVATTVTDVEALGRAVESARATLMREGLEDAAEALFAAWTENTKTTHTLSQEKIQELVQEGRLSVDDVVPMFNTVYSYKLYEK